MTMDLERVAASISAARAVVTFTDFSTKILKRTVRTSDPADVGQCNATLNQLQQMLSHIAADLQSHCSKHADAYTVELTDSLDRSTACARQLLKDLEELRQSNTLSKCLTNGFQARRSCQWNDGKERAIEQIQVDLEQYVLIPMRYGASLPDRYAGAKALSHTLMLA